MNDDWQKVRQAWHDLIDTLWTYRADLKVWGLLVWLLVLAAGIMIGMT